MRKIVCLAAAAALVGCTVIDTGHRGVQTRFGEVQGEPLPEGLYFYNLFTTSVVELDVREEKLEGKTSCYTKDTQVAVITYAMTFAPDPAKIGELYKTMGKDWPAKIVAPLVQDAIQDVIGAVAADDLMGKREETRKHALEKMSEILQQRSVSVRQLAFVNVDFDDAYEKAVEAKVVAIQKAAEARNKTVEIEERAKQQVIEAKAEAESMTIRSEALSKNKGLVEWEAVQALKKWNGEPPQVLSLGSGVTPFANLLPAAAAAAGK